MRGLICRPGGIGLVIGVASVILILLLPDYGFAIHGRPRESSSRIVTILAVVACALLVGVPVTMNTIPVALEKITGNTPSPGVRLRQP